ncbi:MAG: isoleucine--tRNA ligase [Bacteroidota bacterium]
MFKQISDKINYADLDASVRRFWDDRRVFVRSIEARVGCPVFSFFEGPPTANGKPGIHHVMSRTLKDLVCRYKTMQGFQVHRKAGWDTHGLPVEIEVEKALGFKHKDDIVRYGVAKFNAECKRSVWKYKTEWEEMTRLMGYWVDLDAPYVTFENSYIESVWWALRQFYDGGLITKGYKVQPYCPRCETPLSSHEVSLGYKDVNDPSVYVRMKVKGEAQTSFLVWTTTPWTLISNVAIAVHPDVEYVKADLKGEFFILAEARLGVLGEGADVVQRMKGSDLAGKEYERLYSYHTPPEKGWYVIAADFVTTEDGSGIVHMAPAYGEDDYQAGRKHGLPTIHPVNKSGEFSSEVTAFAGKFVKDADPEIIADLKERGLLFKKEQYLHSYPHCWRCTSPLLYYARDSWYIRTTTYAQRMIELNKDVHWFPPEVGAGRFGNWLEENKDWALSRDRFWGTPLPIWLCDACGGQKCVGSIEELRTGQNVPDPVDLHKPYIDGVTFACACGGTMRRTPELIDAWFDSGSMPFAQWHYPFENKEVFERSYPGDFISEGIDQTRGWFYTLHAIGSFLFDKPAFRNVLVNELILDKGGQKMSKSRGNTVDPFGLMKTYGADATRWYLISNSPVWRPTLFDDEGIGEVQRKFFSTLVNTYSFFALYANVDSFDPSLPAVAHDRRPEIDRWVLSELHSLIRDVTAALDAYDATRATRLLTDFAVERLSNWYVRRNRRRFWKSEPGADKISAYQTLSECLVTLARLMAPIAPYLAEEIYRNLVRPDGTTAEESVHLTAFPVAVESMIDPALEQKMERAMTIVSLVRSMREKTKLKVRQPLAKILVPVLSEKIRDEVQQMRDVILDEVNVKHLEFVTDESAIVRRKAKPDFRSLGTKYGKAVQPIAAAVRELSSVQLRSLEMGETVSLNVGGTSVEITRADVEILHEDIKGWLVASEGPVTVALDTTVTEELLREGLAREFVNRVQNLRKESGFQVTDRIRITVAASDRLREALTTMDMYVRQETLATDVVFAGSPSTGMTRIDVNGEVADIAVEKI